MSESAKKSPRQVILEELESVLPESEHPFQVLFYKTRPTKSRPLVYRRPRRAKAQGGAATPAYSKYDAEKDPDLASRFLILLVYRGLIVYAIELYLNAEPVATTSGLQTLFVSKADTTGHYILANNWTQHETKQGTKVPIAQNGSNLLLPPKLSYAKVTEGVLRAVVRCFVDPLRPLRICLFARAEKHYLFPYSGDEEATKNGRKHVATGAELVRWWIKVLDEVCLETKPDQGAARVIDGVTRARLQIPGSEPPRVRSYFPVRQKQENSAEVHPFVWQVGDVFWPDEKPDMAALRCVPRFYDDPLTRYVEYLVETKRATKTGQQLFWMELEGRQEFRLSIVVGIIGIDCTVNKETSVYTASGNSLPGSVPPVSTWEMNRFYEYVTTLDYEDTEMNVAASAYLLSHAEEDPKTAGIRFDIKGKLKSVPMGAPDDATKQGNGVTQAVNVLTGLVKRKKPKAGAAAAATPAQVSAPAPAASEANVLSSTLVRKKPKK